MEKLREMLDICIRHQTVLGYSLVSLLTVASEHIFSSVLFRCPCSSWNMLYGSVFLLVPALILFLLGFMVHARTWHLLTGICPREKRCRSGPRETSTRCCPVLMQVAARAAVAPLTWVAVALFRASFYECAASGSSLLKNLVCREKGGEACQELLFQIPCNEKLSEKIPGELQAQSQLLGWLVITITVTGYLIATCVSHCRSPVSYLQLKFQKIYWQKEWELFEIKAKEHATRLAEINTNSFFEGTNQEPIGTPSNEDWWKISSLYTFSSQEHYYSTLHKYVKTKKGNSVRSREGDQNPSGLELVDETNESNLDF
ncbi:calcium homeostasis modulator protein 6 [Patagioenas fasciata]|uniref:Protein FAM26F n=1 Tax=Patagioenas fasciata monilis TaxID=372326 RepID=A0A1V4JLS9_PATFA|nr:protein FAM26F [Patagioenas fasciata monilis]